jgi:hypothetical protein
MASCGLWQRNGEASRWSITDYEDMHRFAVTQRDLFRKMQVIEKRDGGHEERSACMERGLP